MADEPVAIASGDHLCRLKWHRARRHAGDTAFTPDRIRQGLLAGAAVEVDIRPLSGGAWAVLHDPTLDRETTGTGPVAAITAEAASALRLRDNHGAPSVHAVATLGGLAADLAQAVIPRSGHLQLDLKVGQDALTPAHVAQFRQDVAPLRRHVILSGGDAAAVMDLAEASGVQVGFDPCHAAALLELAASGAFDAFVARACTRVPGARIVYLARQIVAHADRQGYDLIGAVHAHGPEVDVYTFGDTAGAGGADALPEVARLLALNADQITTDDPAGLAALMGGHSTAPDG